MGDEQEQLIREHRPAAIRRRLGRAPAGQLLSNAVLGAIDGCVTTFAVVCGVAGAGLPTAIALVLGFANLLADGFSMAVSNYEAIKAQREVVEGLRKSEQRHIEQIPEGEREEIRQIFRGKGFKGRVLEEIVATISRDRQLWVETMLMEEHGQQKSEQTPVRAAVITFAAFVTVGALPLLPLMFTGLEIQWKFAISAALAGLVFFAIGSLKGLFLAIPAVRSGMRTLMTGGGAAMLAFAVGYGLRELFGLL